VDDDAGRVDDGGERWLERGGQVVRGRLLDASDDLGVGATRKRAACLGRRRPQRADGRLRPEPRLECANCGPLPQLLDRWNDTEIRHCRIAEWQDGKIAIALLRSFSAILPFCHPAILQYYVIDPVSSDPPKHRPLERFWPYADLPEQPTDEELAALDPDLQEALFGARPRPFSITLVFADLDTPAFPAALELARASAEFRETGTGAARRYRARFWTSDAARLRELFEIVGASDATEVLVDDRPVPYARELWLPLVWFLIPR
jgi:hypothetical protein